MAGQLLKEVGKAGVKGMKYTNPLYWTYRAAKHVVVEVKEHFDESDKEYIHIANGYNDDIFVRVDITIIKVK